VILLAFPFLLAGCTDTDWDHVMSYGGVEESAAAPEPQGAPSPPPAALAAEAAPSNAEFCRAVATQDASGNGFDQPTQARIFARSYAQCTAIYTR
jgi:hypothetical protein